MSDDPSNSDVAEELEVRLSGQRVISGGEECDIATSMRRGEDPEQLAREIDGLEYVDTQSLPIGRLAQFNINE